MKKKFTIMNKMDFIKINNNKIKYNNYRIYIMMKIKMKVSLPINFKDLLIMIHYQIYIIVHKLFNKCNYNKCIHNR